MRRQRAACGGRSLVKAAECALPALLTKIRRGEIRVDVWADTSMSRAISDPVAGQVPITFDGPQPAAKFVVLEVATVESRR